MTSNPMLKTNVCENVILDSEPMSVQGAINKTLLLISIVIVCACFSWTICSQGFSDKAMLLTVFGAIAGFILALISAFKPQISKITAPVYAVCEGVVVGAVSYAYNAMTQGIVLNAASLTILALLIMLVAYRTGLLRATPVFRQVLIIATFSVAIFYLAGFIGALLGHPMTIFDGGMTGIIVSVVICIIAALNFILDFDFIEQGTKRNLPNYFEWYSGLTLLVTVVWLYLEILRLLAQLSRRN